MQVNFFKKIAASIYSPAFYIQIKASKLSSAIGYFLFLVLLLTVVQVLPFTFFSSQAIVKFFYPGVQTVLNAYPSDLQISIHNGIVSTNAQEPYILKLPNIFGNNEPVNVLLIDTKDQFSQDIFDNAHVAFWLTNNALYSKQNNQMRVTGFSKTTNATITKQSISQIVNKFSSWFWLIVPSLIALLTLSMILLFFIIGVFRLVYLFFLAFLIWVFSKLLKNGLGYWQAYRVGIYIMTLGLLIDTLRSLFASFFPIPGFPFMFTIIALVIYFINFRSIGKAS